MNTELTVAFRLLYPAPSTEPLAARDDKDLLLPPQTYLNKHSFQAAAAAVIATLNATGSPYKLSVFAGGQLFVFEDASASTISAFASFLTQCGFDFPFCA